MESMDAMESKDSVESMSSVDPIESMGSMGTKVSVPWNPLMQWTPNSRASEVFMDFMFLSVCTYLHVSASDSAKI